MRRKSKLSNRPRRKIYRFILEFPGLSRSELSKKIDMPYSTLKYHLEYMKKRDVIVEKRIGKYLRYYAKNMVGAREKQILNILREDTPRMIILYLDAYISASLHEIANFWKKDPRTVAYHIKKISKLDMIDNVQIGKEIYYELKDSWEILLVIIKYKNVLFDELLEDYLDWIEEDWFTLENGADIVTKILFEMFPHPYHV